MKKYHNPKSNINIINKVAIVTALLVLFLVICSSTVMAYVEHGPINPEFIKYQQNITSNNMLSNNVLPNNVLYGPIKHPTGTVPSPIDLSYLKGKYIAPSTAMPAFYDLRTSPGYNKVTPVKDQQTTGDCWIFSTDASLESYLMPKAYSFSEQNMQNLLYNFTPNPTAPNSFDSLPSNGGNLYGTTAYETRWSGPVNNSDDPWNLALGYYQPWESSVPIQQHVQNVHFIPPKANALDNNGIKQAIINYGAGVAVWMNMEQIEPYLNLTNGNYYYDGSTSCPANYTDCGHYVTIVGWDDNYPASNFDKIPPGNGAFIVKNSWGTSFGDNGYFNISYYDTAVGYVLNAVFTSEPLTNYINIYQYDPLGSINSVSTSPTNPTTGWAANIFTPKSNEILNAVSFYTEEPNSTYVIKIYTNTGSQPTQGTLALTQSGTTYNATTPFIGYYTIPLNSGVQLNAGQNFSVVLELTDPTYQWPISVQEPFIGYSSKAKANASESFVSADGNTWTDLTTEPGYSNTSVCIKAFTNKAPVTKITPKLAWTPNPLASIVSGTALGANLDTTAKDPTTGNPVAGNFVYTDETAACSKCRNCIKCRYPTLTATFTPTDTTTYTSGGTIQNIITVTPTVTSASMNISKSADPKTYDDVGQTITYTYKVTNTGNVNILEPITVHDNKILGGQITIGTSGNVLAVGQNVTGTATYTITQADLDAGFVTNSAFATNKIINSNNTSITVLAVQKPDLKIDKDVDPKTYFAVGDLIDYSFNVTNKGNVDIAGPITVTDNMFGSKQISSNGLAPGQSVTRGKSYLVTPQDIDNGFVVNSAFAYRFI